MSTCPHTIVAGCFSYKSVVELMQIDFGQATEATIDRGESGALTWTDPAGKAKVWSTIDYFSKHVTP